jgi:hypothetical protein
MFEKACEIDHHKRIMNTRPTVENNLAGHHVSCSSFNQIKNNEKATQKNYQFIHSTDHPHHRICNYQFDSLAKKIALIREIYQPVMTTVVVGSLWVIKSLP